MLRRILPLRRLLLLLAVSMLASFGPDVGKCMAQHGFPPNGAWVYGSKPYFAAGRPAAFVSHRVIPVRIHYHFYHRYHHWHYPPHYHVWWPTLCPSGWGYYYRVRYFTTSPVVIPAAVIVPPLVNRSPVSGFDRHQLVQTNAIPNPHTPVAQQASSGPDLAGILAAYEQQRRTSDRDVSPRTFPVARVQQSDGSSRTVAKAMVPADVDSGTLLLSHARGENNRRGTDVARLLSDDEPVRDAPPRTSEELPPPIPSSVPPALIEAADKIFQAGGYREAAKAYAELTVRYGHHRELLGRRFAAQVAAGDFPSAETLVALAHALETPMVELVRADPQLAKMVRHLGDGSRIAEAMARRALSKADDALTLESLGIWLHMTGDPQRGDLFLQRAAQLID
ncbi:MAG: hypothetical protein KatS3mg111_1894 [Pirellulaceae bacterium]|nr:MAG: hypothetical protein KatS3mg111_1894 [Pirellulaceae bacterium]